MAAFYRVYDTKIHHLTLPGGMVYKWTHRDIGEQILALAIANCPVAKQSWGLGRIPGNLKASHSLSMRGSNGHQSHCTITNSAHYAVWVHNGTGPVIKPTTAPYMKFTINGKTWRKTAVRGQRAQSWLTAAMETVLDAHRVTVMKI